MTKIEKKIPLKIHTHSNDFNSVTNDKSTISSNLYSNVTSHATTTTNAIDSPIISSTTRIKPKSSSFLHRDYNRKPILARSQVSKAAIYGNANNWCAWCLLDMKIITVRKGKSTFTFLKFLRTLNFRIKFISKSIWNFLSLLNSFEEFSYQLSQKWSVHALFKHYDYQFPFFLFSEIIFAHFIFI